MTSKKLLFILFLAFTIPAFAQEPDMSLIPYRQGDLWGYANASKTIIIKPEYEDADFFFEGFAAVKKNGKYGYINPTGKVVIPFKFFVAKPFRFGFFDKSGNNKAGDGAINNQKTILFAGASLQASGYEICIDTKGATMPKCPAISEASATDLNKADVTTIVTNYSTIQKSELFDKITGDYKIIAGADETYYIAVRNNNYGVFNNKFEVIVPFEYNSIEKINIGPMVYLKVEKNGLKGMLFGTGSPYLPVDNSKLEVVKAKDGTNFFLFTREGKSGVRNTRYENVVEPIYDEVKFADNGYGFILTGSDKSKGFYFLNGKLISPIYADVRPVRGGQYIKIKNAAGKSGYISNSGTEFFAD